MVDGLGLPRGGMASRVDAVSECRICVVRDYPCLLAERSVLEHSRL